MNDSTSAVEALAAAAETTTDADLATAYREAARAVYREHTRWRPDDHPLLTALARHAHRGHPQPGGLTAAPEEDS